MSLKYEVGTPAVMQDNSSGSLASAAAVLGATAYPNSDAAKQFLWADFELAIGGFGGTPTAGSVVELYLTVDPDLDGNYWDTDNTTPNGNLFVGGFVVKASSGAQRVGLTRIPITPWTLKAYLRNQTGQTINAGWTLTIFPYREQ